MNFYNTLHPYYCGIDLHARSLYVCIKPTFALCSAKRQVGARSDRYIQRIFIFLTQLFLG